MVINEKIRVRVELILKMSVRKNNRGEIKNGLIFKITLFYSSRSNSWVK